MPPPEFAIATMSLITLHQASVDLMSNSRLKSRYFDSLEALRALSINLLRFGIMASACAVPGYAARCLPELKRLRRPWKCIPLTLTHGRIPSQGALPELGVAVRGKPPARDRLAPGRDSNPLPAAFAQPEIGRGSRSSRAKRVASRILRIARSA